MKFCYVILHYKNINDTLKCIDSLKKTASIESKFIIVDNGSNDGTGIKIEEKCKYDNQCEVIILKENGGFSKGNNIGYTFAKENYHPEFIVITNNDVVFYQNDFERKIVNIYRQSGFHILGPDVYIPRHNDHQNPLFKKGITTDELKKEIMEYQNYQKKPKKFNFRLRIHAIKNMLYSNSKLFRTVYSVLRKKDNLDYKNEYVNVGLQGSCLIFSKEFLDNEEKAFEPEPFLYEEECFLFFRCKSNGYKMMYSPQIGIYHEEGASFNNLKRNNTERLSFMLIHHVIARQQLLEYLEEIENERVQ